MEKRFIINSNDHQCINHSQGCKQPLISSKKQKKNISYVFMGILQSCSETRPQGRESVPAVWIVLGSLISIKSVALTNQDREVTGLERFGGWWWKSLAPESTVHHSNKGIEYRMVCETLYIKYCEMLLVSGKPRVKDIHLRGV
ncbi:hypothetical protein PM082_024498 [Marasmius tenuissimus]|nr:hypothetical protein PM082_024498 [Marasmius tenuissimus]